MNVTKFAAAAVIAAVSSTAAFADTFTKYGEVEGWKVFTHNEWSACLMEKSDDAGNVVQMGYTKGHDAGYVGVFTKAETDIKRNAKEAVVIQIADDFYYGDATGMRGNVTEGYTGGYVLSNNAQFFDDVARQYTMIVFPEKEYAFTVDLTGTLKGIEMVRACQSAQ
ncbi:hypothetical protein QEZ52_22375 (plasmid) [Aliisedimentitalea scapharcae]|uniref:Uncharacterized protein n=1 Tax=Aliisedimentitalea scapharcae TaxID=1524259 RepID=A0ABZ2Y2Q1_9RHOB